MECLSVRPINTEEMDCFEEAFAAIAHWILGEYEFMYAESWNFTFKNDDQLKMSDRILCEPNIFSSLLKYYGIEVKSKYSENKYGVIDEIKQQLLLKNPVVIMITSCYCPWIKNIRYGNHAVTIIGYDDILNSFICSDSYYNEYMVKLTEDNFNQGFSGIYYIIEYNKIESEIDYFNILKQTSSSILNNFDSEMGIIYQIRKFAEFVMNSIKELTDELFLDGNVWSSSLFVKIKSIVSSRVQYTSMLNLISKRTGNSCFRYLYEASSKIAYEWKLVSLSLARYALCKTKVEITNIVVAKRINNIAEEELAFAYQLLEVCSGLQLNLDKPEVKIDFKEDKYQRLLSVDIKGLYNNKGFGSIIEDDFEADLNGLNHFFLKENLRFIDNNYIISNFIFPELQNEKFDNISCKGQNIDDINVNCTGIAFLGCAEWGNYSEDIVFTTHNKTLTSKLKLSEFNNEMPIYNEYIAADVVLYKDNIMEEGKLYISYIAFENEVELKSIILPMCPNIHIFSISIISIM